MKLTPLAACAILACSFTTGASAVVLDFEDLRLDGSGNTGAGMFYGLNAPGGNGAEYFGINKANNPNLAYNGLVFTMSQNDPETNLPVAGTAGFEWGSWQYTAARVGGNAVSGFGQVAAFTQGRCGNTTPYPATGCDYTGLQLGASMAVYSNTPFYLNSVDIAANSSGMTGWIIGYDAQGTQVYATAATPLVAGVGLTLAGSNSQAISQFVIYAEHGQFFMDNVNVTPVPEASTYAMMLAGLVGVGAVARRRAKKA